MKDFTNQLVDLIIENEIPRIDKIMGEVTKKVSIDFAKAIFRFLDAYYENYDPTRYVRIYEKRGKYLRNKQPKEGQISLHDAITRGGANNSEFSKHGGTYQTEKGAVSYIGGIEFDESSFENDSMKHIGRGISEWNIVENFIYAGDGVGVGDWRSTRAGYNHPSADELMREYMATYGQTFDKHYKNALKHNK